MQEIIHLINEMSPYLLLGFLLAGLMHAFIPGMVYSKYLGGRNFRSVFYGALFGVPLPLCSCGVIPTAMSLRKEGASKGATTAFLIATPETGIDSIIATYSLLGLPFAILRPIAAFCNALLGGWLINRFDKETAPNPRPLSPTGARGDNAQSANANHTHNCGEGCCCGHGEKPTTFWGKILEALKFGYVEMMQDIGKWLVVGLLIAGLITVFVPDDFFALFRGNTQLSMLLVLCIAIPMYICATGSIPIAVALMLKGLTPGAALVLLMAGPACNMASILVIRKVMGRKTLWLYLGSIITMAIFWGHVVDYLLPTEWFQAGVLEAAGCCDEPTSWFRIVCSIVLACLLFYALVISKHHHHHNETAPNPHPLSPTGARGDSNENNNTNMKTYKIEGMSCNHCRMSAEKVILGVPGVTSATVDLQTKEAHVEGTATPEAICHAIDEIGFTCSEK